MPPFKNLNVASFPLRFTALHYAVQSNSTASVHPFTLVANMSHLPDGNEGRTPLMIAAQNASEPIVKVHKTLYFSENTIFAVHLRLCVSDHYIIGHTALNVQVLLQSQSVVQTINHADNDGRTGIH